MDFDHRPPQKVGFFLQRAYIQKKKWHGATQPAILLGYQ